MKTEVSVSDANLKTNHTPDTVPAENFEDTTADEQNGNVSMTSIICIIINGRSKSYSIKKFHINVRKIERTRSNHPNGAILYKMHVHAFIFSNNFCGLS